jgi:large subunit ribosomal protein L17
VRHKVKGWKLSRTSEHRRALERNLVTALLEHGRIRTTDAKARAVRPVAEKVITLAKRGDLHARRQAIRVVGHGPALERLFGSLAERFADRPGGYTRVIKAGRRLGDGAPVAYLELLDEAPRVVEAEPEKSKASRAKRGKAASRVESGTEPAPRRKRSAAKERREAS